MSKMRLSGYVRSDGRVGFRNHLAVIPLAGCAQDIARRIADNVKSAVLLPQPLGCDLDGADQERLGRILYQLASHPNVGAALFVTLGCASANSHRIPDRTGKTGRPVKVVNIQQIGGTTACVAAGVEAAQEMSDIIKQLKRVEVPLSSIVMATKCGASDKTSFEICHPIVGECCDMLVDNGGTAVLSEDCELYPAVDELAARAVDKITAKKIHCMTERLKQNYESRIGESIDEVWPDKEKALKASLGHAAKAGTKPISKVVRLGELIDAKGLVILDAPNSDLIAITSMAAAGCNLIAFTTGMGTLLASPIVPTIKITANEKTFERMNENIDVLVSDQNPASSSDLFEAIVRYANGQPTKAELTGHGDMFIPLEGVTF